MKNENIKTILKELMSCITVEGNKKEFNKVFDYIENLVKNKYFIKKYYFKEREAIVISNTNNKNLDLVFCTHIDVVPDLEYSFSEDEDNIYGRGTFDMKGAVAVCLELILKNNIEKDFALFITSDEEIIGYCAEQLLEIYTAKLAIIPDGGNNFNLIEEEKGLLQLKLSLNGVSAHASQPYNGENAIVSLMNVYNNLISIYPLPKNDKDYITSVNLSKLEGGNALNAVADKAIMFLDIRHTSKDTKEDIVKTIKSINSKITIDIIAEGILFKTDINNHSIKKYLEISEKVLKREIKIEKTVSTSDAVYFSNKNIPTIIMNPTGGYAHCPNEFVTKEGLDNLYEIYKNFIEQY